MRPRVIGRYRRSDGAIVRCDVASEEAQRAARGREVHERIAVAREEREERTQERDDEQGQLEAVLMS